MEHSTPPGETLLTLHPPYPNHGNMHTMRNRRTKHQHPRRHPQNPRLDHGLPRLLEKPQQHQQHRRRLLLHRQMHRMRPIKPLKTRRTPKEPPKTPGNHPQSNSVAVQVLFSSKHDTTKPAKHRQTTEAPAKQPQTRNPHKNKKRREANTPSQHATHKKPIITLQRDD